MNRPKTLSISILMLLIFIVSTVSAEVKDLPALPEFEGDTFSFVHISDSHIIESIEKNRVNLELVLATISGLEPKPAFIINTGDLTQFGSESEILEYADIISDSGVPVFNCTGNHDSRWTNVGKGRFEELVGPLYYSFDYADCHFAVLDTSMEIEQYGHFDPDQLDWLKSDLAGHGKKKTVFLAGHHPATERRFIDNQWDLMEIVTPYNVGAALFGHIHTNKNWIYNGIFFSTVDGTMDNDYSFRIYTVKPDEIVQETYSLVSGERSITGRIPRAPREIVEIKIEEPRAGSVINEPVPLKVRASGLKSLAYSFDMESFTSVPHISGDKWRGFLYTAGLFDGKQTLYLKGEDFEGKPWIKKMDFTVDREPQDILFAAGTGGGIQSSPTVYKGKVYVGSNDRHIYAFTAKKGLNGWAYPVDGTVISSPSFGDDGKLYCGAGDGRVYALYPADSDNPAAAIGEILIPGIRNPLTVLRKKWEFKTGECVYSSPAYDNGTVYVGSGDYHVYAIDSDSGEEKWRFRTKKLVKSTPLVYNGRVYFGSWDLWFYCLDAETGKLVWKQKVHDNALFPPATSNPAAADGRVIVASHDHVVHCFQAETGEVLWKHERTETDWPSYNSGVIKGNLIYYGSMSGYLIAIDIYTGETVMTVKLHPDINDPIFDSSPVINDNTAYLGSVGGNLYAVDLLRQKVKWSLSLGEGYIFSSPAYHEGIVYVGSTDGNLYAVKTDEK